MRIILNLLPLLSLVTTATAADSKPPNIVLIISDDQGYTDYGFMGHPSIETPHLDKLASESVVFRRGYVPTALCRPSLMTLVTGRYSHQNKTTGNDPANTPANKAHAEKAGKDIRELLISHIDQTGALPGWLTEKGYVSHQSGKWWEGSYGRGGFTEGMTQGFPNKGGRACLFTGCYERKHLYRATPGPLNPELCESSYFAVLKNAGYRTGHLGKEHVAISEASAAAMFDVRRKLGRNPHFKKQPDGSERHETQILGDWGIEFLKEQPKDRPFCLQISFNATHAEDRDKRPGIGHYPWPKVTDGMYEDQEMPLPRLNDPAIYEAQPDFLKQSINRQRYFWRWDTPEKYQTNMRAYFRMISGIDHVVGRLVEQLEKQDLADNTVIIYTADNGYYLGDRGFAGKWTHYEQSLRVPLIVHDPRLPEAERGRVLSQLALNSDLASTMIGLAGLPVPDAHTGRSLVSLLEGKTVADWRTDFLCEFLAVPGSIPRWEGVRDTDWVYARYYVDGTDKPPFEFLHDLKNDPDQLTNLALVPADELEHKNASALVRLRARCDELVAAHGPPMQGIGKVVRARR